MWVLILIILLIITAYWIVALWLPKLSSHIANKIIMTVALIFYTTVLFTVSVVHSEQSDKYEKLESEYNELYDLKESYKEYYTHFKNFTINTYDYVDCFWKLQRKELYTCNSYYYKYKNSWNWLYDKKELEWNIIDY